MRMLRWLALGLLVLHGPALAGEASQRLAEALNSVQLGVLRRHQVMASVVPDMPGEGVLLGVSFLRDLEILQSGTTRTLRPPASSD